ncbi:hypothetical protein HAX54_027576, partial [Datura stramonium]|nr:hypothetical protein [Datura stramonium]
RKRAMEGDKGNLVIARGEMEFAVYGLFTVRGSDYPASKRNKIGRAVSWAEEGLLQEIKPRAGLCRFS